MAFDRFAEYRGQRSFAVQPEAYTHTKAGGWTRTVEYHGTTNGIIGLIAQFEAGGYTFTADFSGPISKIRGTLSSNPVDSADNESDQYTIHQEVLDQDVFSLEGVEEEAQLYADNTGEPRTKYREIIETAVKNAKISELAEAGLAFGTYPLSLSVYIELARGADFFENNFTILTRTKTVPIAWIGRLAMDTVSKIYSSAGLVSAFGLDPAVRGLFPSADNTVQPNSVWGWRRRRQDIQYLTDGFRATITQDWTWARWSKFIYTEA